MKIPHLSSATQKTSGPEIDEEADVDEVECIHGWDELLVPCRSRLHRFYPQQSQCSLDGKESMELQWKERCYISFHEVASRMLVNAYGITKYNKHK